MLGENSRQCMRGSQLLGLLLGILVFFSSVVAKAGGAEDQHVTGDPAERTWTQDITEPYWSFSSNTYTYYGLFLELDSTGHYLVDSSISFDRQNISGDVITNIYGVHYANSLGTLEVHNNIELTAAGLIPVDVVISNAAIEIRGINAGANDVTSSADITLTATGGTAASAKASASGIFSFGAVNNAGAISSNAAGGTSADASASASARGILSLGAVDNTGVISSKAAGGTATSSSADADASADADGIFSSKAVKNAGAISSIATGGTADSSAVKFNADAHADACGIYSSKAVTNTGAISSKATSGTATSSSGDAYTKAYANAYGILNHGVVTNTGDISCTVEGGTGYSTTVGAYGISSSGAVNNAGAISSTATGGISTSSYDEAYAYADSHGIKSDNAVTNTGAISSTATGGTVISSSADAKTSAYGRAYGIYSGGAVTNTGTISATAEAGKKTISGNTTSGDAFAYGIYFTNGGELHSSGLISADAQFASGVSSSGATRTAYQVYCQSGTVSIKQYAMEVGHSQDTFTAMYEGQIGTGEGAVITYDETELVVHVTDNYQSGVYDIPRLWKQETEEQKAATMDQFASLDTSNIAAIPGLTISLIPSADKDTPQKLNMEYAPKESTPLKQTRIQENVEGAIHLLIEDNLIDRFLSRTPSGDAPASAASASSFGIGGSSASMVASLSNPNILPAITSTGVSQHTLLFRPVYVNSYDSASSGYSSNTYGFVLGYDYNVYEDSNDCIIGVHAGYTRGDTRYTGEDYGDRKEFVDTYYGGVHGLSRFAENFIFSGEASLFYTDSDLRDDEPTRLGKADYDSVALRAEASVGYLWEIAEHTIVPELGLDYSWQHRNSFTVNNQNSPDIKYGTLDNNELYAKARLKWLGRYELSPTWTIIPLVGVGVTQVLTDGEISNTMRLGNETQLVVDQDENTTFTPEANITVSSDDYQFMAGYAGGFGGTTKNNMFWLQLAVSF